MTTYRRNFISGGCFFFTVNLADLRLRLLTEHIDELRAAFRHTRQAHPFAIEAMVVLPDHLHAVWTMPEGDTDFATRWRLIKTDFSRRLPVGERISRSRAAKGEPRYLAASLLGAHHSRRERPRASHRLHPHQPRQARAGDARRGLAVLVVSPHGKAWSPAGGLGRRRRRSG
jgi:REP element-mobilizing transposase RayT